MAFGGSAEHPAVVGSQDESQFDRKVRSQQPAKSEQQRSRSPAQKTGPKRKQNVDPQSGARTINRCVVVVERRSLNQRAREISPDLESAIVAYSGARYVFKVLAASDEIVGKVKDVAQVVARAAYFYSLYKDPKGFLKRTYMNDRTEPMPLREKVLLAANLAYLAALVYEEWQKAKDQANPAVNLNVYEVHESCTVSATVEILPDVDEEAATASSSFSCVEEAIEGTPVQVVAEDTWIATFDDELAGHQEESVCYTPGVAVSDDELLSELEVMIGGRVGVVEETIDRTCVHVVVEDDLHRLFVKYGVSLPDFSAVDQSASVEVAIVLRNVVGEEIKRISSKFPSQHVENGSSIYFNLKHVWNKVEGTGLRKGRLPSTDDEPCAFARIFHADAMDELMRLKLRPSTRSRVVLTGPLSDEELIALNSRNLEARMSAGGRRMRWMKLPDRKDRYDVDTFWTSDGNAQHNQRLIKLFRRGIVKQIALCGATFISGRKWPFPVWCGPESFVRFCRAVVQRKHEFRSLFLLGILNQDVALDFFSMCTTHIPLDQYILTSFDMKPDGSYDPTGMLRITGALVALVNAAVKRDPIQFAATSLMMIDYLPSLVKSVDFSSLDRFLEQFELPTVADCFPDTVVLTAGEDKPSLLDMLPKSLRFSPPVRALFSLCAIVVTSKFVADLSFTKAVCAHVDWSAASEELSLAAKCAAAVRDVVKGLQKVFLTGDWRDFAAPPPWLVFLDKTDEYTRLTKEELTAAQMEERVLEIMSLLESIRYEHSTPELLRAKNAMKDLASSYRRLLAAEQSRGIPFFVFLYGEPGTGKTVLIEDILSRLRKLDGIADFVGDTIKVNVHDKFPASSGLNRSANALVFNDVPGDYTNFPQQDKLSLDILLQQIIDSEGFYFRAAGVEDKGILLNDIRYVVITSNNKSFAMVDETAKLIRRIEKGISVSLFFDRNHKGDHSYVTLNELVPRASDRHLEFEPTPLNFDRAGFFRQVDVRYQAYLETEIQRQMKFGEQAPRCTCGLREASHMVKGARVRIYDECALLPWLYSPTEISANEIVGATCVEESFLLFIEVAFRMLSLGDFRVKLRAMYALFELAIYCAHGVPYRRRIIPYFLHCVVAFLPWYAGVMAHVSYNLTVRANASLWARGSYAWYMFGVGLLLCLMCSLLLGPVSTALLILLASKLYEFSAENIEDTFVAAAGSSKFGTVRSLVLDEIRESARSKARRLYIRVEFAKARRFFRTHAVAIGALVGVASAAVLLKKTYELTGPSQSIMLRDVEPESMRTRVEFRQGFYPEVQAARTWAQRAEAIHVLVPETVGVGRNDLVGKCLQATRSAIVRRNGKKLDMRCVVLGPSMVLLNRHYLAPEGGSIEPFELELGGIRAGFTSADVCQFDDTELVVVRNLFDPMAFPLTKFFPKEDTAGMSACNLVFETGIVAVSAYKRTFVDPLSGKTYPCWEWYRGGSRGDCGTLVVSTEPATILGAVTYMKSSIIGREASGACLFNQKHIEQAVGFFEVPPVVVMTAVDCDYAPLHPKSELWNVSSPYLKVLGTSEKKSRTFSSVFRKTVIYDSVAPRLSKPMGIPKKLSGVVDGSWNSAFMNQFKYVNMHNLVPFSQQRKAMLSYVADMKKAPFTGNLAPLDLAHAIFGDRSIGVEPVPMKTSVGDPLRELGYKKKYDLFVAGDDDKLSLVPVVREGVEKLVARWEEGTIEPVRVSMTPKDEIRDQAKLDVFKIRLFAVVDFTYNIALRMFVMPIISFLLGNPFFSHCFGVMNAGSHQWGQLAHHVSSAGGSVSDMDFSAYDTSHGMIAFLLVAEFFYLIALYVGYSIAEATCTYMAIVSLCVQHTSFNGDFLLKIKSMPSGVVITLIFNSVWNEIMMRVAFLELCPEIPIERFTELVKPAHVGDDNIFGISPEIIGRFNAVTIFAFYERMGYVATPASKNGAPVQFGELKDQTFLKRKFVKDPETGYWFAPLDMDSIWKSLAFEKSDAGVTPLERLYACAENAQRELFLHGRPAFVEFQTELNDIFKAHGLEEPRQLSWDELLLHFENSTFTTYDC